MLGRAVAGIDVWANYLHLEHYLLVPWLLLGIGVAVALDAGATASRACSPDAAGDRRRASSSPARLAAIGS